VQQQVVVAARNQRAAPYGSFEWHALHHCRERERLHRALRRRAEHNQRVALLGRADETIPRVPPDWALRALLQQAEQLRLCL
jgi:hypothetical protein